MATTTKPKPKIAGTIDVIWNPVIVASRETKLAVYSAIVQARCIGEEAGYTKGWNAARVRVAEILATLSGSPDAEARLAYLAGELSGALAATPTVTETVITKPDVNTTVVKETTKRGRA